MVLKSSTFFPVFQWQIILTINLSLTNGLSINLQPICKKLTFWQVKIVVFRPIKLSGRANKKSDANGQNRFRLDIQKSRVS